MNSDMACTMQQFYYSKHRTSISQCYYVDQQKFVKSNLLFQQINLVWVFFHSLGSFFPRLFARAIAKLAIYILRMLNSPERKMHTSLVNPCAKSRSSHMPCRSPLGLVRWWIRWKRLYPWLLTRRRCCTVSGNRTEDRWWPWMDGRSIKWHRSHRSDSV